MRTHRTSNGRLFIFEQRSMALRAAPVLSRLPELAGDRIHVQRDHGLRDGRGAVHAGSFLRERRIAVDCTAAEFMRVFVHEVFHFVWLRVGNPRRRSYEEMLRAEIAAQARGELGWSAEWRKVDLRDADVAGRTRPWREYCCESFCDSAAWAYSGVRRHEEFTLAGPFRPLRRKWFRLLTEARQLSI